MLSYLKNTIFVFPVGGLSNRMRVIESGYTLAEATQRKLFVFWILDKDLSCHFHRLFKPVNNITILNFKPEKIYHPCYFLYRVLSFLLNRQQIKTYRQEDIMYRRNNFSRKENNMYFMEEVLKNKGFYYIGNADFYFTETSNYTIFKPIDSIQTEINRMLRQFNAYTIGIHIRQTDHEIAKSISPVELFIEKMQAEVSRHHEVNFFLATDEPKIEEYLQQLFKDKILTYSTDKARTTITGIQQALTDLFLLSKTSRIWGSYFSSFSEMAEKLHGSPLEIIQENN